MDTENGYRKWIQKMDTEKCLTPNGRLRFKGYYCGQGRIQEFVQGGLTFLSLSRGGSVPIAPPPH